LPTAPLTEERLAALATPATVERTTSA
jgi:hypothetical protein